MPRKVLWLACMVTLTYWLGSAVGCAAARQSDAPITEPQQRHPDAAEGLAADPTDDDQPVADAPEAFGGNLVTLGATDGPADDADRFTLAGEDRTRWATITVTPVDGVVRHGDNLFNHGPVLVDHGYLRLSEARTIEEQIDASIDGARPRWFNGANLIQLPGAVLGVGVDLVLAPFWMILPDDPWVNTSPRLQPADG